MKFESLEIRKKTENMTFGRQGGGGEGGGGDANYELKSCAKLLLSQVQLSTMTLTLFSLSLSLSPSDIIRRKSLL